MATAMAVTAITTELLRSCIKVESGSSEKLEERKRVMPLSTVTCLIFSFKSLRTINWLQGLRSLTKLYLDNNDISKIENLSHLTCLTLLDLSFNKISKIEGLETLTNLEDLSLYHNQIDKITGLERLQKMTVLSLGRNRIRRLDDDPEYRLYVISHLRDLTYFDHRYVPKAALLAARDQYQDDMTELKQKDAQDNVITKADEDGIARQELYANANLLGCDTLFTKMISEDPEYSKLSQVPGLLEPLDEFKKKYDVATEEIIATVSEEYKKKQTEIELWEYTMNALLDERDTEARALARTIRKLRKKILAEVRDNPTSADAKLAVLRAENDKIRDQILELEVATFGEVHDIWSAFDNNFTLIVDFNKIQFQNYFGTLRISENHCSEVMQRLAINLMDQYMGGYLEVESNEARELLRDKDVLINAVQASHDARTLQIDSLEDQRLRGEEELQKTMNKKFRQREHERNRERIEEAEFIHQTTLDEITDLLETLEIDNT